MRAKGMFVCGFRTAVLKSFSTMPPCDFVPKKYKGPTPKQLIDIRQRHIAPAIYTIYKKPVFLNQGHLQWLYDVNGRRYLDLIGGICTISVGHSHPKLNEKLKEQIDTLWHPTNLYYHPKVHEYAEHLASKMPGDLKVVYFVNSGTEANDLALMLARLYTGNNDVISLRNSYHGLSTSMVGLSASGVYKQPIPSIQGIHHAILPDMYRGLWGGPGCRDNVFPRGDNCDCFGSTCQAEERYVEQIEEIIRHSVPGRKVAGMFAEPIQGVGGVVQYPKKYLKRAQDLLHKSGGVFIADEVQTGFGRLGDHFWGFEWAGLTPDIVTMAKGIGNGFPLGAVVTTPAVAQAHQRGLYFNTFGGNPLASAVGKAVLEVIEEERLQENSHHVGTYLIAEMLKLQKKYDVIGDVRGRGLMVGVELVSGGGNKAPMAADHLANIMELTKDMGILFGKGGYNGNVLRIKPALCLQKADVDFLVHILDKAIEFHKNPQDCPLIYE